MKLRTLTVTVLPMKGCYESGHVNRARYFIALTYTQGAITLTYDKNGEGLSLNDATHYAQSFSSMIKDECRG